MNENENTLSDRLNQLPAISVMEILIALVCIFIPPILRWAEHETHFRISISNYVYMDKNAHMFGFLLTIAAMLFIFNGVLYYQKVCRESHASEFFSLRGKWYNLFLGLAVLGVLLFPHKEFHTIHYASALFFFLGSAVFTAFFHNNTSRVIRIVRYAIAIACVLSLASHFIFKIPKSLLIAEWISLIVIAIHYILDSLGILGILVETITDEELKEEERVMF